MKHASKSVASKSGATRQGGAARGPVRAGWSGAGHIGAERAKRLRSAGDGGKASINQRAFLAGTHTTDDLAEGLAESAVASMTSGEDELRKVLDDETTEERGGPFVDSVPAPRSERVKGRRP